MKTYYLFLICFLLSGCGPKNIIGLESQMHYMELESNKSMIALSRGFLTIDLAFCSYIYYGSSNYSLMGRWHITNDTLVLTPQYEIIMNTKNDSIHTDYLWTTKKRNTYTNAKPIKCLFKGKELYILPNDEPFIFENEDGSFSTIPPHWHSHTSNEPRKFVVWRKTTRGDPFKYLRRYSKNE